MLVWTKHILELEYPSIRPQEIPIQKGGEYLVLDPFWHLVVDIALVFSLDGSEEVVVPAVVEMLFHYLLELEIDLVIVIETT